MNVEWLTIWLDFSRAEAETGRDFWRLATGTPLDAQHVRFGSDSPEASGVRLGLAVTDPDAWIVVALDLGATSVTPKPGTVRSPAGFVFTIEPPDPIAVPAPVVEWPDHHRSRADQLTIDVAPNAWDDELFFWRELTGWTVSRGTKEFARLGTPSTLPVRLLLQRKHAGSTSAHVDIATDDRMAEVDRLALLGATRTGSGARWTVLQPPVGPAVCVTDRDPDTGLLIQ